MLNYHPNTDEVNELILTVNSLQIRKNIYEKALANIKNANDYFALVKHLMAPASGLEKAAVIEVLKNTTEQCFKLAPSIPQVNSLADELEKMTSESYGEAASTQRNLIIKKALEQNGNTREALDLVRKPTFWSRSLKQHLHELCNVFLKTGTVVEDTP